MIKLTIFIIVIAIFNLLETYPKIKKCKKYISILEKTDEDDNAQLDNLNIHKIEILSLLVGALAKDETILRYMDTNGIAPMPMQTTVFNLFPYQSTVNAVEVKLKQSLGFYESLFQRMLNPLYWIHYFLNLPSHIIVYLGIKNKNVNKVLNIIWRVILVIWWFFTPTIEHLRDNFLKLIMENFK